MEFKIFTINIELQLKFDSESLQEHVGIHTHKWTRKQLRLPPVNLLTLMCSFFLIFHILISYARQICDDRSIFIFICIVKAEIDLVSNDFTVDTSSYVCG